MPSARLSAGTKLDSIRSVIRSGKVCVLDCSPVSLKTLYNSAEFHPYVVFLAAPGVDDVEKLYRESATTLRNSSRSLTVRTRVTSVTSVTSHDESRVTTTRRPPARGGSEGDLLGDITARTTGVRGCLLCWCVEV